MSDGPTGTPERSAEDTDGERADERSASGPGTAAADTPSDSPADEDDEPDMSDHDEPDMGDLVDELEELEARVDSEAERELVRETIETAIAVQPPGTFDRVIRGFDRADAAEAFLGAVLFGIPMFVEGGTEEVGAFLATSPALFAGTLGFAVAVVYGILYVAEIQDVRVQDPFFGFVPRRLVWVVLISAATAIGLMTAWGRVEWAADPWLAVCSVSVAFVPMSIGAALGDILPGS